MTAISIEEARGILDSHDLIAIGARADEERQRRHGKRTTFVRVLEVHVAAVPIALPSAIGAGEVRVMGQPASIEAAVAAITRARSIAGSIPVTAFSLEDLWTMAGGSEARYRESLHALKRARLESIAEAAVDMATDPIAAVAAAREAGLLVPRLTVRDLAADRGIAHIERARDIQSSVGGIRAFAPLARVSSVAQPSTGYDDVKQIAIARLLLENIESIQVDWPLYGPKLAQVALTMGADDIDGVSPLEGDLGRRRSPIEEIRGNIRAAGLEPIERDGTFAQRT